MTYKYSIVTLARWEDPYLVEWVCYHKLIGFDHIYFYCNEQLPFRTYEILLPFIGENGFITFVHFPYQGQQRHIYLHFMENFLSETEWLCFLDIDEFLRISGGNDLPTLMSGFPSDWDSIYFNWMFFGNNEFKTRPSGSVLQSYTKREIGLDPNTKTITKAAKINPAKVSGSFWHHWFDNASMVKRNVIGDDMDDYWKSFPEFAHQYLESPGVQQRIMQIASINHYAFKSEEDLALRIERGVFGDFAGQDVWKRLAESGNLGAVLDAKNAVEDTVLKDYWESKIFDAACATGVVPWPALPNLSLGQLADQSSTSEWSIGKTTSDDASRVVNGIITGTFNSHTGYEQSPWWSVDLGSECLVHEIRIFNRIDDVSLSRRLGHFTLEISSDCSTWEVLFEKTGDEIVGGADGHPLIRAVGPIAGRYVRIRLSNKSWLHLDQVEIYGIPLDNAGNPSEGIRDAPGPRHIQNKSVGEALVQITTWAPNRQADRIREALRAIAAGENLLPLDLAAARAESEAARASIAAAESEAEAARPTAQEALGRSKVLEQERDEVIGRLGAAEAQVKQLQHELDHLRSAPAPLRLIPWLGRRK